MKLTYDEVVSICDAHGICLPVDCVETVVSIVEHIQPDHSGDGDLLAFLDAAAGEGFVLNGVDAADLYIKLFPERYASNGAPGPQDGGERVRFEAWANSKECNYFLSLKKGVFTEYSDLITQVVRDAWKAALASNKAAAVAAGEPMTTVERGVIDDLLALTSAVFQALDNSEEREGDDGREHAIDATWFDPVCTALDKLEALPDDQPGYTMDAPAKAGWALRNLLSGAPAPIASAEEAAAWLVDGLNGYNERSPGVWIKKVNADASAAGLFKSSVTPLYTHPAAAQLSRAEVLLKLRAAQMCHPNAVQPLIEEAIDLLEEKP